MLELLPSTCSDEKRVVKRQHRKSDAKRYRSDLKRCRSDMKRFGSGMKCVKRHEAARRVVKRHLAGVALSA